MVARKKDRDHPIYHLFSDEPNPKMIPFMFRGILMGNLILWGSLFSQNIIDGRGRVIALDHLKLDNMTVSRSGKEKSTIYIIYIINEDKNIFYNNGIY